MKFRMYFISGVLVVGSWAGSATAQVFTSGPVAETSREEEAGSAVSSSASSEMVEIISFSGSVHVRRNGSSGEETAEEGMMLSSGDTVRTGAGSFAELGFDDGDQNVVRVEEGSTSVVLLKEDQKIELLEGEVFSVIRDLPPGRSFEVVTPTAVAGARGTEWVTRYTGQETEVEAYDDEPFVKVIGEKGEMGEETRVSPGFATRIAKFSLPTAPARIPVARQQRWQNMRQAMQQRVRDVRGRRGKPDRAAFRPDGKKRGPGERPEGSGRGKVRDMLKERPARVEGGRQKNGPGKIGLADEKRRPAPPEAAGKKSANPREDRPVPREGAKISGPAKPQGRPGPGAANVQRRSNPGFIGRSSGGGKGPVR